MHTTTQTQTQIKKRKGKAKGTYQDEATGKKKYFVVV